MTASLPHNEPNNCKGIEGAEHEYEIITEEPFGPWVWEKLRCIVCLHEKLQFVPYPLKVIWHGFIIGNLCERQHRWKDTDRSRRYAVGRKCVDCVSEYNSLFRSKL